MSWSPRYAEGSPEVERDMRRVVLFFLLLFTLPGWCQEADFSARKDAAVYLTENQVLSSSDKDVLCGLLEEPDSSKSVMLPINTRVKLLKRSRFLQQQTVYDRENSKSRTVQRLFKVALVEVLSGENKGKSGWVVVSYRETGGDPVVYFSESLAQSPSGPTSGKE